MSPSRRKPDVALSQVPSVKELCNRLGFQRATQTETTVFTDATHMFRRSYKCSDGTAGSDLTDWNSPRVQQELAAMAMAFLAARGNGELFWSDCRRWMDEGDLTHLEDKRIIAYYLKQLFWKQNKYALNNQNYIQKKVIAATDQSNDRTTPAQEIMRTTSTASTATLKPAETQEGTHLGRGESLQNAEPRGPIISLLDEERNELADQMQSTMPANVRRSGMRDIFEVPEDEPLPMIDPSLDVPTTPRNPIDAPAKNSPKRGVETIPDGNTSPEASPLGKRPKIGEKAKDKKNKKKKLLSPRRRSDRQRAHRVIPEAVPEELLDSLLDRKSGNMRPTSVAEHAMHTGGNHQARTSTKKSTPDHQANVAMNHVSAQSRSSFDFPTSSIRRDKNQQRNETGVSMSSVFGSPASKEGIPRSTKPGMHGSISDPPIPFQRSSDSEMTPDSGSKPKPKVRGTFWIITSPEPNYSEESWNNGQINGKSLSTVIEEVSSLINRDRIEKLKIKLQTSLAQTTTTIHKNAEDHWDRVKRNFEVRIKEAFLRDGNQQVHFDIWIEPIYEQNALMGGTNDAQSLEIDW